MIFICHHTLVVHQLQDVNAIPYHHWALRGEAPGNGPQVLREPWTAAARAESRTFPASIHSFRPWWEPNTSRLGSLSAIRPAWSAAGCHSAWWRISPGCPQDGPGCGEVSHKPSFWRNWWGAWGPGPRVQAGRNTLLMEKQWEWRTWGCIFLNYGFLWTNAQDHTVTLFPGFWGTSTLFSTVAAPIPTNGIGGFQKNWLWELVLN